jgi:hypothetical protein
MSSRTVTDSRPRPTNPERRADAAARGQGRFAAVYFDLDGTLLGHDAEISTVLRATVQRLKLRGVRIGIATGRRATTTRPYASQLDVDAPCVLFNGARVVDATLAHTLFSASLPLEATRPAIAYALSAGIHVVVYVEERLLSDVRAPTPRVPAGALARSERELVDLAALASPPTKVLFVDDDDQLLVLRRALLERQLLPNGAHLVRSGPRFLELLPEGVHKGAGLQRCAQLLGVEPAAIVAVGDDENDREMLAVAGLGLAMGHAPASVRASAARVVGSAVRDDGSALAAALDDVFGL